MADLVRYRQADHIQSIVEVTQAAQREIAHIHTEGARIAIQTLSDTTEYIQSAAQNGASEAEVAGWVEEQKAYLEKTRQQVLQGSAAIASVAQNLPALPAVASHRRLTD